MTTDLHIAVVEDDPHYRGSLETLLEMEPGFALAGSYGSAREFLASLGASAKDEPAPWDVVLMDIDLPGMSGIEATRELKRRCVEAHVVILTAFEDPEKILSAIRAGADGYLVKRAGLTEVVEQLRSVAGGGSPMTPTIARSVLALMREADPGASIPGAPRRGASELPVQTPSEEAPAPDEGGTALSERELAVLTALVNGRSYKQIAADLDLSTHTVRTYIRRVYGKLRVHSATEAVSRALRGRLTK